MNDLINQTNETVLMLQNNMPFILKCIVALYAIHIINALLGHRLCILGVYPRKLGSVLGIFCYPFIHGHFNHLFFNSIPLFILASFVLLHGYPTFFCVSITIIVSSGILLWLFARRGVHIGASGLIMGYWSYLLINAYFHPGAVASIAPGIVCLYYFGGLLFHLFPTEVRTSFEAHIFGFLGGIAAYFACPVIYCQMSSYLCSKIM